MVTRSTIGLHILFSENLRKIGTSDYLSKICPKTVKIGLHLAKFNYFYKNRPENSPLLLELTKVIKFVHIIRDIKTHKKMPIHGLNSNVFIG